jgi:hypothetical protein
MSTKKVCTQERRAHTPRACIDKETLDYLSPCQREVASALIVLAKRNGIKDLKL